MRTWVKVILGLMVSLASTALLAGPFPDLRVGPELRGSVFRNAPSSTVLYRGCGAVGQTCCKWSKSLPGQDPRYCLAGAGCDITTNTCVAPCGGSGQVCCDGPDTYAPQADRSPTGLYCFNGSCSARKQMCDAGACTKSTRRCDTQCGKTAGAACCAPDAGIAVASCKSPGIRCAFGPQGMTSGVCVPCGGQMQEPCPGQGCDSTNGPRLMEHRGLCIACGFVGGPKCPEARKCDAGGAPDPHGPNCIPGGGKDQPCLEGRFCGYDGMFCDASNSCRICGQPGQPCCPQQALLGGGFTKECGGFDNLQCANFNGRRVCQYKPGMAPGAGTPPPSNPNAPKTCGGQPYQFGVTNTYIVWLRQATGCAVPAQSYQANSANEAVQCGRNNFGDAVITEPVHEMIYSMNGPLGCRTVTVYAKDTEDGSACAQSTCVNCNEPFEGVCP